MNRLGDRSFILCWFGAAMFRQSRRVSSSRLLEPKKIVARADGRGLEGTFRFPLCFVAPRSTYTTRQLPGSIQGVCAQAVHFNSIVLSV